MEVIQVWFSSYHCKFCKDIPLNNFLTIKIIFIYISSQFDRAIYIYNSNIKENRRFLMVKKTVCFKMNIVSYLERTLDKVERFI